MSNENWTGDTGLLSPVGVGSPVEGMVSDSAWIQAMTESEAALARAQASLGIIPAQAAVSITRASQEQNIDPRKIAIESRETANPVVSLIREFTELVRAVDPEAAEYVHRGSTSQDILDTAAMLISKRAFESIYIDLETVGVALRHHVEVHSGTEQAGRTLGLHAVPITFGWKAAGWSQLVDDARRRVEQLLREGLPVSLGGAAGTLAGYIEFARAEGVKLAHTPGDIARELTLAYANELGLSTTPHPWHALRTPIADIAATSVFVTGALGKIAVDVLTLSRTEIGELAEGARKGRGASSAMPHKRNPVLATMIRSAGLQVPGLSSGLYGCMLAADERDAGAWHAEWFLLRESLRLTGGAAHTAVDLVEGLVVDRQAMQSNLQLAGESMTLERVAIALAPVLGKVRAKELLSDIVDVARTRAISIATAAYADPRLTQAIDAGALSELLRPENYMGAATRANARFSPTTTEGASGEENG